MTILLEAELQYVLNISSPQPCPHVSHFCYNMRLKTLASVLHSLYIF